MISEEMLRTAADRASQLYATHLEQGYDPANQHQFSVKFEKKIQRLKRKADNPVFYRVINSVAAITLTILLAGSVWMTVDAEARRAFFGWVKEIYGTYLAYHSGDTIDAEYSDYRPAWIPDGYAEFTVKVSNQKTMVAYSNDIGQILRFNYIHNPDEADWFIDISQAEVHNTMVNERQAELLLSKNVEYANAITWSNEAGIAFSISGFVCETDLIAMAESVEPIKSP